jgi:hypothetical protein
LHFDIDILGQNDPPELLVFCEAQIVHHAAAGIYTYICSIYIYIHIYKYTYIHTCIRARHPPTNTKCRDAHRWSRKTWLSTESLLRYNAITGRSAKAIKGFGISIACNCTVRDYEVH